MSVFKTRRAKLLPLAVLISVLLMWQPWVGLEPRVRGVKFGLDIVGGSRMVFELQGSRVTIQAEGENQENLVSNLLTALEINLDTPVQFISYDSVSGYAIFDVGRYATAPLVQTAVQDFGTVVNMETYVTDNTLQNAVFSLKARIDPYDIIGTQLRTFGKNSIIFESSGIDPTRVKDLLGKQGKFEAIIDNLVVLTNSEVERVVEAMAVESKAYAPVYLTETGAEILKLAASGKVGRTIVIYLDRPSDAILVFDNEITKNATDIRYDEKSRAFFVSREGALAEPHFYLSVSAVAAQDGNIPQTGLNYLNQQLINKTRVIILGAQTDFSNETIQKVTAKYKISTVPRREGESVDGWIRRACGVVSTPVISEVMAAGGITKDLSFAFVETTRAASLQKAQNFQKAVTRSLAVPISLESEATIGPSLGMDFIREIPIAGGVVVLWMIVLLYVSYSRLKIALAIIVFALVDIALTLGAISAFGLTFGFPTLVGLLFFVITGLNQHIIIVNEMVKGVHPQEKVSVGWRTSRALSIVYLAIFTTILVSTLTAYLGFEAIRMFSMVAAIGMIIAILLTRPVFARVVESILSAKPSQPKPPTPTPAKAQ